MSFRRFFSIPSPFRFWALALLIWVYFIACFALHPASSIREGRFVDPDNSMYLAETLAWLDGQGWYDRTEHRLNPPAGVPIHFSRLMEMPYAAAIAPLRPVFGSAGAATAAAAVWPPLFLLALFFILRFQARILMPRTSTFLTVITALFAKNMLFVFMPGQAGHHGLIALLIAAATATAAMTMLRPETKRWPVLTGLILALALSVALECLPWLLLIAGGIGLCAAARGGAMAKAGGIFSLTLLLAGTVLLATYKPPETWLDMDLVAFSSTYILLLVAIALCMGAAYAMRQRALEERITLTALAVCIAGGGFLAAFPALLTGPYGAVDAKLMHFMMPNISEAIPMIKRADALDLIFYFLLWPLLSLGICIWQIFRGARRRRQIWMLLATLQAAALALASFYQSRYTSYAQMFGIVPIAFLMQWGLRQTAAPYLKLLWYALPAFLMVLLPAVIYDDGLGDVLLFPMQSYTPGCDLRPATETLSKPPYYTGTPRLILNTMDDGPELLLRTPDNIISGPYHENVAGNLAAAQFFRNPDLGAAEAFARNRGADFVLLCRNIEAGYLVSDKDEPDYASGFIRMPLPAPLAYQLITGHTPNWLRRIDLGDSDILLFQVVPERQP